jgi:hypothetical protein
MKSPRDKDEYSKYGDEAPRVKDLVIVVVVFIILTILGYIAWDFILVFKYNDNYSFIAGFIVSAFLQIN